VSGSDSLLPALALGPEGAVAVVWQERRTVWINRQRLPLKHVMLCVLDDEGNIIRAPFHVNSSHLSVDAEPDVMFDEDGDIVVTYTGYRAGKQQIFSVRYRVRGGAFEDPVVPDDAVWVNSGIFPDLTNKHASISNRPTGEYVVAWETFLLLPNGDLDRSEIQHRLFPVQGDADYDTVPDGTDNCPDRYNPTQGDLDKDKLGDACDPDSDDDGVANAADNCPLVANADQANADADLVGDACDNCKNVSNPDQADWDTDGMGNACDACFDDADNDPDGDNRCSHSDVCPDVADPGQEDQDFDQVGDACDTCPTLQNYNQADSNGDGVGDACELFLRGDSNRDELVDISDGIFTLSFLFTGGPKLCTDAMDADDDGVVNITDPIFELLFLFVSGPPIPAPYPDPGIDATPDELGCEDFANAMR
jgi:hypothetical protein